VGVGASFIFAMRTMTASISTGSPPEVWSDGRARSRSHAPFTLEGELGCPQFPELAEQSLGLALGTSKAMVAKLGIDFRHQHSGPR
jgi:hypothetical protein